MEYNGIGYNHHFADDWNTTHTTEPSSSPSCMNSSTVASSISLGSTILCTYPNGTTTNMTKHNTLPPHYYGNTYSSTTKNKAHDTTEGMIIGAIFSGAIITSLLLSKYLYIRYKATTTTEQDLIHRHSTETTEPSSTKINVQDQYTKLEESLCNMYVMEHNSEFCHHQHDDIIVDNAQQHMIINYENDVLDNHHHYPYDIESHHGGEKIIHDTIAVDNDKHDIVNYKNDVIDNQDHLSCDIESHHDGEQQIIYDTKCSLSNNNIYQKLHNHNNVLHNTLSTISDHSITTSSNSSCISSCSCNNNSTCRDDDDVTVIAHYNNECSICLDQFQVGQIVSISSSLCSCQHIFHHICIKEWLLKHNTCPSCRQVYFQDDMIENIDNIEIVENMNHNIIIIIDNDEHYTNNKTMTSSELKKKKNNEDNKNDMIMFYCICHGISYCLPPPKSSITNINDNMNHQSIMISSSSSSSSSLGNNTILDNNNNNNNNPNNQVHYDPNILSVPTPSELSNMRIQNEQPTISSPIKQEQQRYQDDDILVHNDDDTINDHHGSATISNAATTSTDDYILHYL